MKLTGIAGKTAIVTGAAGGIGASIAELLTECGATVLGTDVDTEGLNELHEKRGIAIRELDVSDSQAVEAAVAHAEQNLGPIAIGVNTAGSLVTGLSVDTSDEGWRRVFDVNATGVFNVSRALARRMCPRGAGNIVTVSSNAAGIPRHGMAAYAASKAAGAMFTRSLGLELAPHGVRCNIVCPGSTRTPMQTGLWDGPDGEADVIRGSLETWKTGIPLGRIAEPRDVAEAVVFLLSDQAKHLTMVDLYVDGGATLRA